MPRPFSGVRLLRPSRTLAGTVLLTGAVFGLAVAGTLELKGLGESGVQAERDLQGVATELSTQDALEWRVISGRLSPEDVQPELAESRERARALISRADAADSGDGVAPITALHDAYADAVDEELRLLAAGELEEAEEFDEAEVDPAYAAALEVLTEYGKDISADAARARSLSSTGLVLTVVLSLVLTAVVQSRRKRAEVRRQAERRSEARYRALVDRSSDLVVVTDRTGTAGYLSPSAERLFDRSLASGPALDLSEVTHPQDRPVLAAALAAGGAAEGAPLEIRLRAGLGWRTFEVSVQDLTADPAVAGLVLTGHDVTDRQALQQELEHRALHDALTGLPNRALLADRFAQALRTAQRDEQSVGLLLIDLDRFKEINDTLGHHFGDELLRQVGPRMAGVLREADTIARLGGDEFAVLLPGTAGVDDAVQVAEKLQTALSRSFQVEGVELDVEASIGVVLSGEHGAEAMTLMQRADVAMYVAKQRNLGVFPYDPSLDTHSPERLSLLGDLRRALHDDELFLQYQPKVSLSTGEVCGAEALLRWAHPDRGLVPPDAFVPLAENTGLIGPLTRRVLDLALAQVRRWAEQGRPLQISVNLSARNLLDDRLDTTVAGLLAEHGVAPQLLKLEVTESAIMADPARAAELLRRLHARGIAIAIDDFGAGYTSLGQLKNLPVSELKVDRSFVTTMQSDSSDSLIVRSVIELSHNLGLSAVAEGVEDAETLDSLTAYSCDVAQGYHLSRPMAADAFDAWRAAWPGLPPTPSRITAVVAAGDGGAARAPSGLVDTPAGC
ncbi:putative bifunctional diguanylate cyclase/phosphodiesterase [Geodermatophilus maliterrae]|uniref:Bifunctional diguanylate cyclase/phosphodiesterase n=1 Tax=Geodermatophilus maliterrae TaxID=3162531 RepID=A0ABV3XJU4_9ACTN